MVTQIPDCHKLMRFWTEPMETQSGKYKIHPEACIHTSDSDSGTNQSQLRARSLARCLLNTNPPDNSHLCCFLFSTDRLSKPRLVTFLNYPAKDYEHVETTPDQSLGFHYECSEITAERSAMACTQVIHHGGVSFQRRTCENAR